MTWEVLTDFPTCAIASLGDPRLVGDESWQSRALPFLRLRRSGYGMLYGLAEADGVPVELARRDGVVVGARVEFTDDVAKLEEAGAGRWVPLGSVRVGARGAVACALDGGGEWTVDVPLPAGRYEAESFATLADDLGIRLVAVSETSPGPSSGVADRRTRALPGELGGPATPAQKARRQLMRATTLARLDELAADARSSDFTIGVRVRQPREVRRLQERIRAVSGRWAPRWISPAAAQAPEGARLELEHVVPVVVLTERVLLGDDVEAVLGQAVVCTVTYEEHKRTLAVAFRSVHREVYKEMRSCPLDQLGALGWQRYHQVGLNDCYEVR